MEELQHRHGDRRRAHHELLGVIETERRPDRGEDRGVEPQVLGLELGADRTVAQGGDVAEAHLERRVLLGRETRQQGRPELLVDARDRDPERRPDVGKMRAEFLDVRNGRDRVAEADVLVLA